MNAERTLRALNFQACNIYEACFYFNNQDGAIYDSTGAHTFFESTSNLANLVSQLSQVSGSEVIYKSDPGCIEVLGAERAIRNVYQRLQEMQFLQVFHQYTIFRVESSNEQRDFISGKKNGKINKIMKTSGAKIRFMPFINDYNFIIEVESTSFTKALDGLTLLQEELPAEISFYVPESYHKRIIGVGGKNIQRIMKKYGVYVKFSNTEEFASLGGYYNNQDNVVARTPMKNQINLDNLRHAVMELIHPKDRDYVVESIRIPFGLHRDLIHEYQDNFIAEELIKKTNTHVLWPDAELADNNVELLGPEAHMALAFKMMETIVPDAYDLHLPLSTDLTLAIRSDHFQDQVVDLIRQEHDISVEPISYTEDDTGKNDGLIRFKMTKDKVHTGLHDALTIVLDYLSTQNVDFYPNSTTADELFARVNKNQSLSISSSSHHLLDTSTTSISSSSRSVLNQEPSLIGHNPSSVSMMRSSSDAIYSGHHINPNNNPSPTQPYQFFHFQNNNNDTKPLNNLNLNNNHHHNNSSNPNSLVDNNNNTSWNPPYMQLHHQAPIPSVSTSGQSNGSGDHLRAIFDAPMELTDQERVVLSNYRYQRMNIPPASNFGFAQAVPPAPTAAGGGDIWSTQMPGSGNRRPPTFTSANMASSPSNGRRSATNYSSNTSNDSMQMRVSFEKIYIYISWN